MPVFLKIAVKISSEIKRGISDGGCTANEGRIFQGIRKKKSLNRAFKMQVSEEIWEELTLSIEK